MGKKKRNCFIIMPITTPSLFLDKYDENKNHFSNVLKYLFIPAIEKIDHAPLPPETEGSQIIQTDIIAKLNTADLVLCDISVLNPNVFFELGIRTALNKPVCLVKDKITKAPFDTSPLKYEEYDSKLHPWQLEKDIPKIVKHLNKTIENSIGKNKLWESFGIKISAEILEKVGEDSEFSYMKLQLDSIQDEIRQLANKNSQTFIKNREYYHSQVNEIRFRYEKFLNLMKLNKDVSDFDYRVHFPKQEIHILFEHEPHQRIIKMLHDNFRELNEINWKLNISFMDG